MDWDEKEVEAANTLAEMANGDHLFPDKQKRNGVVARKMNQQEKQAVSDDKKMKQTVEATTPPEQEDEDEEEEEPQQGKLTSTSSNNNAGFPFPIVAFLSAVRVALITPSSKFVMNFPGVRVRNKLLPSLTFDQIMQRLSSNPGDIQVVEMTSKTGRLEDLLRGALRIFLSSSLPSPANSWWRPLVVYHKHVKHWSWIGPLSNQWPKPDTIPTSPQAWGTSLKILNWLSHRFNDWLKATRGTLQRIASLPPPPLSLMPPIPIGERFQMDRNVKNSVQTIKPSCEEVKAYFQKEESVRYSIPRQTFSYTTRDGQKSSVVPLVMNWNRRKAKKPREHFVLKPDRPPSFTVLCLVRDAAARLPHGSGTRSDICTLARDSQFLKENVTDGDLTQVVIGALDRLTCELDPCLTFDKNHRLWHYLHADKEEMDFLEDPTLSRKRMKNKEVIGSKGSETHEKEGN